jgi:hypothetical protein
MSLVLGFTHINFVIFATHFIVLVTVKYVKVMHSLISWSQCFLMKKKIGKKPTWTKTHGCHSKINNFLGLSLQRGHFFIFTTFSCDRMEGVGNIKVEVMLWPMVSRPVCLGVKPHLCPRPDICYCQTGLGLLMWSTVSDERSDMSFLISAGPRQHSHSQIWVLWDP